MIAVLARQPQFQIGTDCAPFIGHITQEICGFLRVLGGEGNDGEHNRPTIVG